MARRETVRGAIRGAREAVRPDGAWNVGSCDYIVVGKGTRAPSAQWPVDPTGWAVAKRARSAWWRAQSIVSICALDWPIVAQNEH
jgi:hypothetical protein